MLGDPETYREGKGDPGTLGLGHRPTRSSPGQVGTGVKGIAPTDKIILGN